MKKLWARLFPARYYDREFKHLVHQHPGAHPAEEKVAIYVIFPEQGVLQSHLMALNYICENGYAPLVVSNLNLTGSDREMVLANCWRLIERPNFGYDFGAYREGILSLGEGIETLERLVLLNDSCWFPVPGSKNWLAEAEVLGVDLAGATSNFGISRETPEDFASYDWDYSYRHRKFHYCSFALSLSQNLISSPTFGRFWKAFPMSDLKRRVIRNGEIGFTTLVIQNGFLHGCTLDPSDLDKVLGTLNSDQLAQLTRSLIIPEMPELEVKREALLGAKPDKSALIGFVLHVVAKQGAAYVLASYSTSQLGYPFLKKSPMRLSVSGADQTLELISAYGEPFAKVVEMEATALRQRT